MLRSLYSRCASRAADLAAISAIILLAFLYTTDLHRLADLSLYDETNYMDLGRHLATRPMTPAAYSPFYVLWYALLSKLRPDALDLFFSNVRLLIILLPLAFYAALRSLSVRPILAIFAATVLIYGPGYAPVYPKCSHLAAICLLLTLSAIFLVRSVYQKASICCTGLLIASYLRPEFFTGYLLAAAIVFVLSIWNISRRRMILPVVKTVAALACTSTICFLLLGIPWPGDSRSFVAFGQHFSENWVAWNHSPLDPWTAWESIVQSQFGDVHSFSEALLARPALVARHVLSNVTNGLAQTSGFYSWYPTNGVKGLARWQWLTYWLIFLAAMVVWRNRSLRVGRKLVDRFIWIAICFFPPVISCVLVYPREHYLLFLALAAPLAAAALISEETVFEIWREVVWTLALACCAFLFHPAISTWFGLGGTRPEFQRVQALRQLRLTGQVHMLEGEGNLSAYLADNYTFVVPEEKHAGFQSFQQTSGTNVIVVTERLATDIHYVNDPEFLRILRSPMDFGFHEDFLPGMLGRVLVSNNLVDQTSKVLLPFGR